MLMNYLITNRKVSYIVFGSIILLILFSDKLSMVKTTVLQNLTPSDILSGLAAHIVALNKISVG